MTTNNNHFDPGQYCSRKLWQLVANEQEQSVDRQALQKVIDELAERRHYLAELERLGKLSRQH